MAISFGKKEDDVVSLIAARKYARAVEILKEQLQKRGANPSLRMQLADVLILADKKSEAVALLLPLADQYASEGFAAKAVSVLKKVQKVDPFRRDVDARLARLIEEKQREAVVLPLSRPSLGIEGPADEAAGLPDAPGLEIGFEIMPVSAPAPLSPAAAATDPSATLPVESPFVPPLAEAGVEPLPVLAEELPAHLPVAARQEPPIEDYDLLYAGEAEGGDELLLEPEPAEPAAPTAPAELMSAGQFADELMSLVDNLFRESPQAPAAPAAAVEAPAHPIVVSPLFRDFSVDEMVAVIQGLKLLAFERGDVILREGQAGASLYMLTSGRVRAFRKDATGGKQVAIGDLDEGAFFGEISILTGQPRTASVVALSRCELLELDRSTLDEITKTHPHVWDVLREFAGRRGAAVRRAGAAR